MVSQTAKGFGDQRMNRQMTAETIRRWAPGLGLGSALLVGLVFLGSRPGAMMAIQRAIARLTSGILNLLGQSTSVVGTTVQSSLFGINVVAACTGVFLTGAFLIAVAVLPSRWTAKLIGLGLGLGGIFVVNLTRLVSLYYLGV
ncbi:MAG TPA: hypothetical protein ENN96_02090, partial [Candidatus Acetothermia bacterium]|nr:hypothetical protein [Candidatus Acetothermia bacterium]